RIDRTEAVAVDFVGHDVIAYDDMQPLQFQLARAFLHPGEDLVDRMAFVADRQADPGNQGAHKALYGVRLFGGEVGIDDQGKAVSVASVVGETKHREVVSGHAAVAQVHGGQVRQAGDGIELTSR